MFHDAHEVVAGVSPVVLGVVASVGDQAVGADEGGADVVGADAAEDVANVVAADAAEDVADVAAAGVVVDVAFDDGEEGRAFDGTVFVVVAAAVADVADVAAAAVAVAVAVAAAAVVALGFDDVGDENLEAVKLAALENAGNVSALVGRYSQSELGQLQAASLMEMAQALVWRVADAAGDVGFQRAQELDCLPDEDSAWN
mmetsp:Transcript_12747/g.27128  ORF Transcript_12747/g.27128 Transcript_12747/m.27128 type:complete len:200 (+) Transcript_12747:4891-5490(+)